MCGILGVLECAASNNSDSSKNVSVELAELRQRVLELSRLQRHRGPDWSGIKAYPNAILAHERLAIVDIESGAQPIVSKTRKTVLAVNGEIYNHREIRKTGGYEYQTDSDCEVILALYEQNVDNDSFEWIKKLRGMFAFILYDPEKDFYLIARDPIGIIPLYLGYDEEGRLWVSSEMKAILPEVRSVSQFAPGTYMASSTSECVPYYSPNWLKYSPELEKVETSLTKIRQSLEEAVVCHLMTDTPFCFLLSGGLDSSLITAIASRHCKGRIEDDSASPAWFPQLHTVSIGLEGSPDLKAAKIVASHLKTIHHEMIFTVQEALDALPEVIQHIETFDVTTIRASTPMYLMARKIKAMGMKVVLSGEGADEIAGGYLYFKHCPNAREMHEETVRKLERLHCYDCLRANKSMMSWGIEARVPFLDTSFLDVFMGETNPKDKMTDGVKTKMEKHLLREAFQGYLPDSVLWRQKEQFSDGVGFNWIDSLKEFADSQVSDSSLSKARFRFPKNTPRTKEAYLYRTLFEKSFPLPAAVDTVPSGKSIACSSSEAFAWMEAKFGSQGVMDDPSGRAVTDVHLDSY